MKKVLQKPMSVDAVESKWKNSFGRVSHFGRPLNKVRKKQPFLFHEKIIFFESKKRSA